MTARDNRPNILSKAALVFGSLTAAIFGVEAAFSPLAAQKEQFERSKPHVNVGTAVEGGQQLAPQNCCGEATVDEADSMLEAPAQKKRREKKPSDPARR